MTPIKSPFPSPGRQPQLRSQDRRQQRVGVQVRGGEDGGAVQRMHRGGGMRGGHGRGGLQ